MMMMMMTMALKIYSTQPEEKSRSFRTLS